MTTQNTSPSTLLVTGAAGFIGSNFVRLALQQGYSVIGLDALTYAGHKENLENLSSAENFELIEGNICDSALVQKILTDKKISTLINFAAESHVDRSITGPAIFVETNVLGTCQLLNASLSYWRSLADAEKKSFRYIQVSTDEVYGSLNLNEDKKFSEQTPVDPRSPYSASKTGADHLVHAWHHTYQLPTIVTRCSNNYGPYQFPEKLIPHMIDCALTEKPLPVYGQGINVRDWIHVEDHCAGILLAAEKGKPGSVYCFGGNAEQKNIDVVTMICKELDQLQPKKDGTSYQEQISFVTDRLGHDLRYAIDDSLAQRELHFQRKYNFSTGLAQTIRWYLENQSWCKKVLEKGK